MKKILLLQLFLIVGITLAFAQQKKESNGNQSKSSTAQPTSVDRVRSTIKLDENAQVRGADGMEYPYAVWRKLAQGGKHSFKLLDGKNPNAPIFLIYELSQQEIESRLERMPKPMDSAAFTEGDTFNYFSFRDTDNKKYKKEDLVGKVLVINFWFINCPPCRQEIPDLNKLVEDYKDNDKIIFIAVGLDEWVDVKEFIKKTPFTYHLVTDGRYTAKEYGVTGYPTNLVVDTEGKIAFQSKGGSSANPLWMKKAIDKALE